MIKQSYLFCLDQINKDEIVLTRRQSQHVCRVMVLEENMIRVLLYKNKLTLDKTWMVAPGLKDVPKEGRNRLDLSLFTCPQFDVTLSENEVTLVTNKLTLKIQLDGLIMSWYKYVENELVQFASDRSTQSYNFEGELGCGIFHYMTRKRSDLYYGLGEKSGLQNRHGQRYIMKNIDPMGYDATCSDPLYKHIPFFMVKDRDVNCHYGIFYDNLSNSVFDMGKELDNYHGLFRYYQASAGDIDYYLMSEDSFSELTKKFSWLTGRTLFVPKWSIGYSGSTMHYTDASNADELLRKFIGECKEHDILCDSFQLSSGYTSINDKRYVFNWNYDKFPNPKDTADYFSEHGIALCANVKPALLIDHPMFEDLKRNGMFIKNREGNDPEIAMFWDELGAYIDFTNPQAYEWWKNQVIEKLLQNGISSTWNDNNEFEIWDEEAIACGFGKQIKIAHIKPLQTMLMLKSSMDAQVEFAPKLRPYLISRSGCPGIQRYVQTWSGDNYTSFETLQYNIKMGIGLSISGIYNIGHDVGGFAGSKPSEELFVRWVQQGIFWPRFTIHSWNDDGTINEPWIYEDSTSIICDLIKFRAKITPYIYQLLYKCVNCYEPMIRPTFYNYEYDEANYLENDEFMLGESFLVVPVVKEGQTTREVYLPNDKRGWYDYNTDEHFTGGQTITMTGQLNDIPLLVRGGSIIPINTTVFSFDTKNIDKRGFLIYSVKEGIFEQNCYEDDGLTNNYQKGEYGFVNVKVECNEQSIIISYNITGNYEIEIDSLTFKVKDKYKRKVVLKQSSY